jgi:hypothetical protein
MKLLFTGLIALSTVAATFADEGKFGPTWVEGHNYNVVDGQLVDLGPAHHASVRGLLYACERTFSGPLSWPHALAEFANYSTPEAIATHARLWGATESHVVVQFPMAQNAAHAEMLIISEA